jgi:hypothetical protein
MPIARFEAPKRGGVNRNVRGTAGAAAASLASLNPLPLVFEGLRQLTHRTPMEQRHAFHTVPIEVNTDTGQVVAKSKPNAERAQRRSWLPHLPPALRPRSSPQGIGR